ncbi:Imidazole glycerol phosphate synthase subunit HisH [Candidatus Hydrogenisulfobacillus filiaventi]|uniref:Imidazole glycerol phosphate synthase subunit HisH n=1 Tax=Candidatus Hydrogenisulfobacillus filiaventi TaxID=2707344 RepID=A0A6F8ZF24_9FIRM|nr:imidazole glycerol phosphate synthase subunit HisH [Bacillota bacterium]CAB1128233.1 Imidazole glycerol phosphate synthase subunit HisH [Candidatus Hydrogenisulfobacillus filiaventi]
MVPRVAVIDYGIGNIGSIVAAWRRQPVDLLVWAPGDGARALDRVRRDPPRLLVLPGVGSMAHAAEALEAEGYWEVVLEARARAVPLFGVCLGMQLLFESGEEGGHGFGFLAGDVPELQAPRLPHMGWNQVRFRPDSPLGAGLGEAPWFYFVHSYRVRPRDPAVIAGETIYGEVFPSALALPPLLFAAQFHPELSGVNGHRLLANVLAAATGDQEAGPWQG